METGSIKFLQWYYVPKAYMYMCMVCYRRFGVREMTGQVYCFRILYFFIRIKNVYCSR
jgi:hypothetical protein